MGRGREYTSKVAIGLMALQLLLSGCGKKEAREYEATPPEAPAPLPEAPREEAKLVKFCGRNILVIGEMAFFVDLATGDAWPMEEGVRYYGSWGCCFEHENGKVKSCYVE